MRRFALPLLVLLVVAPGSAFAAKKKVRRERPPPVASTERRVENPPAPMEIRTRLSFGAGAFFAGGANVGPSLGATATFTPSFASGRFSLDLELDWRMARFSSDIAGLGTLTSTLHQFPIVPALRVRVLETKAVGLDARVGVGALFVLHALSSDYAVATTRSALGWEAFAGAQLRQAIAEALELTFEVRVGLGEAAVPFVLGRASGVQGLLGVRYALQ
ncbi:MAG: hypothetical protein IRZ16_14900 [Myxococcaceae bacterium]|nr:hypothetical protein [Myxococcaceae bacterium]